MMHTQHKYILSHLFVLSIDRKGERKHIMITIISAVLLLSSDTTTTDENESPSGKA